MVVYKQRMLFTNWLVSEWCLNYVSKKKCPGVSVMDLTRKLSACEILPTNYSLLLMFLSIRLSCLTKPLFFCFSVIGTLKEGIKIR